MKKFLQNFKDKKRFFYIFFLFLFFPVFAFAVFDGDDILIWLGQLIMSLASQIMYISSFVFDNMLAIGLSTNLFNQDFVKVAWSNIRDVANIGFILGVIYVSFKMLLNKTGWDKSLLYLIIVIFTINFSLFFSRVIVDAGNITAHVFLSAISINIEEHESYFSFAKKFYGADVSTENFKSVGAVLNQALQPEKLVGIKNFEDWQDQVVAEEKGGSFFIMSIFLFIIIFMIAKSLFTAAFMFLGRLIRIVGFMLMSPIAFMSLFIFGTTDKFIKSWLLPLIQCSFCIVIYLFFLWVAVIFLQTGLISGVLPSAQTDFAITIAIFVIKGVFIYVILKKGNDYGSKLCEDGNSTFGAITGVFGGAAKLIGKTPIAGISRTILGNVGHKIQTKTKDWGSGNRFGGDLAGRVAMGVGEKMQKINIGGKNFDAANTAVTKERSERKRRMSGFASNNLELKERGISNIKGKDGYKVWKDEEVAKVKGLTDAKLNAKYQDAKTVDEKKEVLKENEIKNKDKSNSKIVFQDKAVNTFDKMLSMVGSTHSSGIESGLLSENQARNTEMKKNAKREKLKQESLEKAEAIEDFKLAMGGFGTTEQKLDTAKNFATKNLDKKTSDQLLESINKLVSIEEDEKKFDEKKRRKEKLKGKSYSVGENTQLEQEYQKLAGENDPISMLLSDPKEKGLNISNQQKNQMLELVLGSDEDIQDGLSSIPDRKRQAKENFDNITKKSINIAKSQKVYEDAQSINNDEMESKEIKATNVSANEGTDGKGDVLNADNINV